MSVKYEKIMFKKKNIIKHFINHLKKEHTLSEILVEHIKKLEEEKSKMMKDFSNYYLDNIEHIFAFSETVKLMQIFNFINIIANRRKILCPKIITLHICLKRLKNNDNLYKIYSIESCYIKTF